MKTSPRKQCKKCPWKIGADPLQIPNGYSVERHLGLRRTIAPEADLATVLDPLQIMGCHEHSVASGVPCVGWIINQLGPGNNIALRLRVMLGKFDAHVQAEGPQHQHFEDTLPR